MPRLVIRQYVNNRVVQIAALTILALGLLSIFTKSTSRDDGLRFAGDNPAKVSQRMRVECPKPGPGTLVLVGLGQSNAGNWGELTTGDNKREDDVIEYWQGNCYVAVSPMLGATGEGASLWPQFGQAMIQAGLAKQVLFSVFAVDGAAIGRFVPQGDLWPLWRTQLKQLREKYPVDYYLWLQGEADFARRTSKEEYTEKFGRMRQGIEELDTSALVFVPVETYCANIERWTPSNDVSRAQSDIPKVFPGTLPGVNMDALLAKKNARWDGCHPSTQGYAILSDAWKMRIIQEMHARTSVVSNSSQVLQ